MITLQHTHTPSKEGRERGRSVSKTGGKWQATSSKRCNSCRCLPTTMGGGVRGIPNVAACLIFRIILVIIKMKIRNGQKTRSKLAEAAANGEAKRQKATDEGESSTTSNRGGWWSVLGDSGTDSETVHTWLDQLELGICLLAASN